MVAETEEVALVSGSIPGSLLAGKCCWRFFFVIVCFVNNNRKHSNVHILVSLPLYCSDVSLVLVRPQSAFCFLLLLLLWMVMDSLGRPLMIKATGEAGGTTPCNTGPGSWQGLTKKWAKLQLSWKTSGIADFWTVAIFGPGLWEKVIGLAWERLHS